MAHRFNPAHMERLLSPERETMLPPAVILGELQLSQDSIMADIGCGPGYFVIPAARLTRGTVYGVDVEPQMLTALQARADEAGLSQIRTLEGSAEKIPLASQAVDASLCAFVLHEVQDLAVALAELRRVTKAGGRVCIVEWEKHETSYGPPLHERLGSDELRTALEREGFHDVRLVKPNADHYMLMGLVPPAFA